MSTLLLGEIALPILQQNFSIGLNWLGQFIRILIEGVGSVGLGVIVFALILKAITTPFDIYQRVNMRKQSLVMRSMQEELEKLQKQYANDKRTYNDKVMELQKKNGINLMSACLPMIISLVILLFAVSGFQTYSQYSNLNMYRSMAKSYNEAILEYAPDAQEQSTVTTTETDENGVLRVAVKSSAPGCYLYYTYEKERPDAERSYYIDLDKFYYAQENSAFKAEVSSFLDGYRAKREEEGKPYSEEEGLREWFRDRGAQAAAAEFRSMSNPGFLWIKNVWYPDVSYQHPIQDYNAFCSSISSKKITDDYGNEGLRVSDIFDEESYNSLTSYLVEEKDQPNGYYILIILTIILLVVSQLIMMHTSKESTQYQSADGQAATTQKMMLIMMPLIYTITGFLWTAAFSIYMVVSTVIGICITLISNFFLERKFRRQEEEALKARYTRTVPWKKDENSQTKNRKK